VIQAWFDVGNVLLYGYPQAGFARWGEHRQGHLKDFKRRKMATSG